MLIMKKILSVVWIIVGTFFLLVAAICVEAWFSDPAYAADMEISGLIMCVVLGIFGVILIVLGIQTLRLQKLYREYKEIAEASGGEDFYKIQLYPGYGSDSWPAGG
mgnify:CR=1 FL=1